MSQLTTAKSDALEPSPQHDEVQTSAIEPHASGLPQLYAGNIGPDALDAKQVRALQKTHGNQYVARMMQRRKTPHTATPSTIELSAQFNISNKLQRLQTHHDVNEPLIGSQNAMETHQSIENHADPIQLIQPTAISNNDAVLSLKSDNASPLIESDDTKYEPDASLNLESQLDMIEDKQILSEQAFRTSKKDKIAENVNKVTTVIGPIGAVMTGVTLASTGLSVLGLGLPVTAIVAALGLQASILLGVTLAGLQGFLTTHNALKLDKGIAATAAWGTTIQNTTQDVIAQTNGTTEPSSSGQPNTIADIDEQMSKIRASKDKITPDIEEAKTKSNQSLTSVTKLRSMLSSVIEPPKSLLKRLKGVIPLFSDKPEMPEFNSLADAKNILFGAKNVSSKAGIPPKTKKESSKSETTNKPPIQRVVWELVIRPLMIIIKSFLIMIITKIFAKIRSAILKLISSHFTPMLKLNEIALVDIKEIDQGLNQDKKKIAENERSGEDFQIASDDLLDTLEQEKQALISE